jgi:hypothetical protein
MGPKQHTAVSVGSVRTRVEPKLRARALASAVLLNASASIFPLIRSSVSCENAARGTVWTVAVERLQYWRAERITGCA